MRRSGISGRLRLEGLPGRRLRVRPPAPLRPARGRPVARADLHDARYDALERLSLDIYEFASGIARERGIIIADTKFEFGIDMTGELVLADEVLTPDSSRFWPADEYEPGRSQPSFDKQYLRDWLEATGWDKQPPAPDLPDDVVAGTRQRYAEAYQRLTGEPFSAYLQRNGVSAQ